MTASVTVHKGTLLEAVRASLAEAAQYPTGLLLGEFGFHGGAHHNLGTAFTDGAVFH